jgi:hypothetical protein
MGSATTAVMDCPDLEVSELMESARLAWTIHAPVSSGGDEAGSSG